MSHSATMRLIYSWAFLSKNSNRKNLNKYETVPCHVEQHIHMLMFHGQSFDLVFLSDIHQLGPDPCWWREPSLLFIGLFQTILIWRYPVSVILHALTSGLTPIISCRPLNIYNCKAACEVHCWWVTWKEVLKAAGVVMTRWLQIDDIK